MEIKEELNPSIQIKTEKFDDYCSEQYGMFVAFL